MDIFNNSARPQIIGIPWYYQEDYKSLLAIFEDSANLPDTFDDWLLKAEQIEQNFRAQGVRVVRAYIESDSFPSWCASKKMALNTQARTEFANFKAIEAHRQDSSSSKQ